MVHGEYLDVIGNVVKDIIELKWESSDVAVDWDKDKFAHMCGWYSWAVPEGLVEVVYKYGELLGFASWVRLLEVPKTHNKNDFAFDSSYKEGPVVYVVDSCFRDDGVRHGTLMRLWHMIKNKNEDCEHFCWHQGKTNELRLYENVSKYETVGV